MEEIRGSIPHSGDRPVPDRLPRRFECGVGFESDRREKAPDLRPNAGGMYGAPACGYFDDTQTRAPRYASYRKEREKIEVKALLQVVELPVVR